MPKPAPKVLWSANGEHIPFYVSGIPKYSADALRMTFRIRLNAAKFDCDPYTHFSAESLRVAVQATLTGAKLLKVQLVEGYIRVHAEADNMREFKKCQAAVMSGQFDATLTHVLLVHSISRAGSMPAIPTEEPITKRTSQSAPVLTTKDENIDAHVTETEANTKKVDDIAHSKAQEASPEVAAEDPAPLLRRVTDLEQKLEQALANLKLANTKAGLASHTSFIKNESDISDASTLYSVPIEEEARLSAAAA